MNQTQKEKECSTCQGFGLWAMGDPSPMYPMDAKDGLPTIECPECHANANPVDKDEQSLDDIAGSR